MAAAGKLDLYKKHQAEYATPKSPQLIHIRPARYLSIQGRGEPGGEVFLAKLGALYAVAFTVKMARKFAGRDYTVCKLEGLWWGSRKGADFSAEPPHQWNWKLLVRTPEFITEKDLRGALEVLQKRGKGPQANEVRLETIEEGLCVQMLHVGPYGREWKTIAGMETFVKEKGLSFHGLHHEIYLSDPRRVVPERLRTILRMPVK